MPPPKEGKGKARDKVGKSLGISGKTVDKLVQIQEAVAKEPEKFGDLPTVMNEKSINAAHKELQKRKNDESEAYLVPETPEQQPAEDADVGGEAKPVDNGRDTAGVTEPMCISTLDLNEEAVITSITRPSS